MRRLTALTIVLTIFSFACGLLTSASTPEHQPVSSPQWASPTGAGFQLETFSPAPTFTVKTATVPSPLPAIRVDMISTLHVPNGSDMNADGYLEVVVQSNPLYTP